MISGLIAPTVSAEASVGETIWHYMQSGPGVFKGDLHFYTQDGDDAEPAEARSIRQACPLYLLTGEYDYSCSPADSRELAARIKAPS